MQRTGHENGVTPDVEIGFNSGVEWAKGNTRIPTESQIAAASYAQWQIASRGLLLNYRQFRAGFEHGVELFYNGFIDNQRGA